jgi:16S rRNA (guanine527-N7)-methyltransferase
LNDPFLGEAKPLKALDLLETSQAFGLIGPGPLDSHVRHSVAFSDVLRAFWGNEPTRHRLLDLGSGGGVPGLVLAELWPGIDVTLLDAGKRRCELLQSGITAAGWETRVSVVRGRAEDLARVPALSGSFDAVVARSFGPPAVTAECASGFLSVGGLLVVSDPPAPVSAHVSAPAPPHKPSPLHAPVDDTPPDLGVADPRQEIVQGTRWSPAGLDSLGLRAERQVSEPFHFSVFRQVVACANQYPRRNGLPAKRPLF